MKTSRAVQAILRNYEGETPGVKGNLARMLMEGQLGGTGKLVILPVDQGFEHGPARSFAINPAAYDPHYHYRLADRRRAVGLCRAAGHARGRRRHLRRPDPDDPEGELGQLADVARPPARTRRSPPRSTTRCGSAARRSASPSIRARTWRWRCSRRSARLRAEAAAVGLATVIWSYPRGEAISKDGETAIDIAAYAAQIAALLGAHIIKIKLSTDHLELPEAKKVYRGREDRHRHPGGAGARIACRRLSAGAGSWCSRAARRRARVRSSTTPGRSATAAATARSSAATRSSGRATRRWRCWAAHRHLQGPRLAGFAAGCGGVDRSDTIARVSPQAAPASTGCDTIARVSPQAAPASTGRDTIARVSPQAAPASTRRGGAAPRPRDPAREYL